MTDNLDIWRKLERTDPEQTKTFQRPGGFKGTAVRPIYAVKKMTETFGPCGQGWGTDEPRFTIVGDAVFCTVAMWWDSAEEDTRRVYGVGGDIIVKRPKSGEPWHDDEAFKKAYTDAITNAMKLLGMSADVHMGLFDDSKYVASARQAPQEARGHSAAGGRPADTAPTSSKPHGPIAGMSGKRAKEIAAALNAASSLDALDDLWASLTEEILTASAAGQQSLMAVYNEKGEALEVDDA